MKTTGKYINLRLLVPLIIGCGAAYAVFIFEENIRALFAGLLAFIISFLYLFRLDMENYHSQVMLRLQQLGADMENHHSQAILRLKQVSAPTSVFHTKTDFFRALLSRSIACTDVHTHMFSDPPKDIGSCAEDYFEAVNGALKTGKFNSFHRIATVHSTAKAKWIIDTLLDLRHVDAFSLAIQNVKDRYPLTSFHIATSPGSSIVIVWATMTPGALGQGFEVENAEVAQAMKEGYIIEFRDSIKLKEGRKMHWPNITCLATDNNLLEYGEYKELLKTQSGT